eukprot:CAMPEP_0176423382 /NCGR_PEP_ID=MMETSP0127-20121128/10249_1 /TAXON_ID=938130 /ORGANISM="Platyophrya macrostoma, Strain WH" /LENGTH=341 /DNA_ID=CAMNT_0017804319 /DNA_START=256 /DNA_END=1281 /DNA_ORIENTATION=+
MGICFGIAWYQPLGLAWGTFPEKKGLLYGIYSAANYFALIFFNQMTYWIVNPYDHKPVKYSETEEYYDESVYNNVPTMFFVMSGIYLGMMILAAICSFDVDKVGHLSNLDELRNDPQYLDKDGKPESRVTSFMVFKGTLYKYKVWLLYAGLFCGMIGPSLLFNNYKTYGQLHGYSDGDLTMIFNLITFTVPVVKLGLPALIDIVGNRFVVAPIMVVALIHELLLVLNPPGEGTLWYYAVLSLISTLSYHSLNTATVTYANHEFPKESHTLVISMMKNMLSVGDMLGQGLLIIGVGFTTIFSVSAVLLALSAAILVSLKDGSIMGIQLPPKRRLTGNEKLLT